MGRFWEKYDDMDNKITQVQQIVYDNLHVSAPVNEVFEYLMETEGKNLRAGLTILCGRAGGCDSNKLVQAAAAFEMLHMATLVHDDIIDESKLRRGSESLQSRFGKDIAVYTGDYILARAFRFISENDLSQLAPLSRGIEKICQGEIMQNLNRYNEGITLQEYLKIISGKTAAMFYMCAWAGAYIAGMENSRRKKLANSAKHMGLAFQIMDDCRDYGCDCTRLRKNPGSDLRNGIYTLPLLYAVEKGEVKSFPQSAEEESLVIEAVKGSEGLKKAHFVACRYLEKARSELAEVGSNKYIKQLDMVYRQVAEV